MSETIPEDLRFAPAHWMNSAPHFISSHIRHLAWMFHHAGSRSMYESGPKRLPSLTSFAQHDSQHVITSHMMLSIQHSMHEALFAPLHLSLLKVKPTACRSSANFVTLWCPKGAANFVDRPVITSVIHPRVLARTSMSSARLQAAQAPQCKGFPSGCRSNSKRLTVRNWPPNSTQISSESKPNRLPLGSTPPLQVCLVSKVLGLKSAQEPKNMPSRKHSQDLESLRRPSIERSKKS
mmetsp:Transcript_70130/g.196527  ORF Transcript_70130/g.196527 Transcript_70130/m.196527 type:complete len:236 (+) Transcript_70130:308-1015(+)